MEALERYVRAHSEPEDALLQELDRETHLRTVAPRMVSGHIQGRLLELLVRMLRPQRVLEIGTFTGYSALSMAAGLEEGARLDTVEVDLVFIDGDKREYPDYYRMLLGDTSGTPLVHSGSVLIADNILWSGKVVEPVAHADRHTQALLEFNRMVVEDPRVENVIVPLRDGLNLIRVR